ncbi:E3 ubiquitin-protein ligase TRIM36 isoform X2 [Anolis carolinensis]|uniref:Tripartite motif containing 36 n=1 Tax=Anolis carolinensis TaxID=28377 RepID=H9GDA3_ANOCA|nr:PREDICTED: E3 ubiquitin-protein ligase TRIM36 isoform X1 [Anolis carolinensis]|eukprot:XP_008112231.1 PREDICTED: E3 ubiquitin-protein ligase TRIM36 isoform X1 [Anolis carolinensis]
MEGDRLEPAVTIKNIERELICPACKELFTHPVILPCQHSICHKCVKEILYFSLEDPFNDSASETSNQSSPRNRMHSPSLDRIDRVNRSGWKRNSLTPKTTVFPCPGCRHDIDLGERGISGLFRNFTLETIVERYRQAARAATAIMCDLCKPPPQESTKSCMDCSASYCNECFKIHHPWGTLKAQHEYVGPTTNFRPKILMCPEHEMERVNMYCELCKRPVCHLCKLGGTHANHRVTSMSSAYKILKEKLSKDIDYLISKESQVKSQITELGLLMKEAECNGERAKEEASNNFDKLFDVLEERRATALRAIEASKNMRLEKLQSQIEEYQGLLENNGLVGYAQEVLKETDQSCFVQTAKQLHERIQKATESLRSFRPAAQASFEDFVVDIAKQQEALGDLSFHSSGVDIPEINEEQTKMYNKALISWDQPQKISSADTYILEYRKLNREETPPVWQEREVFSKSEIVSDLDTNSSYAFRVRGYKGSICSPWSREVILHTPPAPVFSFLFDDKCGYNAEHLILNMRRNAVENKAGFPLLLGADRIQAGCYTTLDYIIGDTGIVKGKHFWAFHVEPYSYLVKAGVASDVKIQEWFHNSRDLTSPRFQLRDRGRKNCHHEEKGQKEVEGGRMEKRYEQDSGHDSGSEDIFVESLQPFTLVTLGMKKFFIPKASPAPVTPKDAVNRILPMPSSIGICLDCDKGKVGFYDADRMKCLYERQVDCSGTMYPAFALMGSAGIHLEETIAAKYLQYQDEDM